MFFLNYLSVWSLFKKEILRFIKVGIQTILGPAASALLFLAVFQLALGRSVQTINNFSFSNFIAPGLIMMTMLQNSFANSASSIGQSKSQGNIVDILMAPLGDIELTLGYVGGSIVRGLICGAVTAIGMCFFISISIYSIPFLIFYSVMGCMMMGTLGTMVGIWADKWDQQQGVTNFIILPLTFLSGTFYSISKLPEFWQNIAKFNPFFYNIDGFRYAFLGISDGSLLIGGITIICVNLILLFLCYFMFKTGYKLKS